MLSGACAGGPIYFIVTCHSHSLFNNDLSEFSQLLASLVLGRYLEGKVVLYSGLRVGERAGTYDPCLYFSARKDVRGSHGWPVALSGIHTRWLGLRHRRSATSQFCVVRVIRLRSGSAPLLAGQSRTFFFCTSLLSTSPLQALVK